jgi:hypothetical protein
MVTRMQQDSHGGDLPRGCLECEPMETRDRPGALTDMLIGNLGLSLVERTDRLASDISVCNAKLEDLNFRMYRTFAIMIAVGFVLGATLKLLW